MKQYTITPKGEKCLTIGQGPILMAINNRVPIEWLLSTYKPEEIEDSELFFTREDLERELEQLVERGYASVKP